MGTELELPLRSDRPNFQGRRARRGGANVVLDNLPADAEFVVFFDDPFYPHGDWLRVACDAFRNDPTLACVTGMSWFRG